MGNHSCCLIEEPDKDGVLLKAKIYKTNSNITSSRGNLSTCSSVGLTPTHSHRCLLDGECALPSPTSGSVHSSTRASAPFLGSNMMRLRINRNPFDFYKTIRVLGTGSMGTVSYVQKRKEVIGGSARKYNVSLRSQMREHGMTDLMIHMAEVPVLGDIVQKLSGFEPCSRNSSTVCEGSDLMECSSHSTRSEVSSLAPTPNISTHGHRRSRQLDVSCHSVASTSSTYEVRYALKSIHLSRVSNATYVNELKNEIEILKNLDHPHIVRPIETFEFRKEIFVVMELCSGGDLYTRDPYTEEQAARIVSSILSAVSFMHERNVIHRDIKYENVMFANRSPNAEVKLIDFGLSKKYFHKDDVLKEGVGTIYTMAPQVFMGQYTSKADVWSIGVLTFMLLSSHMPFYGRKKRHVVDKIMKCSYSFTGKRWRRVSQQAKHFVSDLLIFDPEDRPTASEALASVWLNKRFDASIRSVTEDVMDNVQVSLEMFSSYTTVKKLALMVIAHKSTSEEIGFLRKAFFKFDSCNDGTVTYPEFHECLAEYGYNDEELENMFRGADIDGTGRLSYTEFLAATIEATGFITEERLAEAFDRLDSDDSGYITIQNLREILGEDVPGQFLDEIIDESDITKDHRISYDEFLALFEEEKEEEKRYSTLQIIANRKMTRSYHKTLPPVPTLVEETSYDDDVLMRAISPIQDDAQ